MWYSELEEFKMPANPENTIATYEKLRSSILALELEPGENLTERALETLLETSRTTVRAALQRLEGEGLVQKAGRGFIVSPIDLEEIEQACAWREVIEVAAVKEAVKRATKPELEKIQNAISQNTVHLPLDQYMSGATNFHLSVARLSGNAFIVKALEDVLTRLSRTRWFEAGSDQGRERAGLEHAKILELIANRDGNKASREIANHLVRSGDRLLENLKSAGSRLQIRGSPLGRKI
jgi:DNA-binding GntR family transcriptional regulator